MKNYNIKSNFDELYLMTFVVFYDRNMVKEINNKLIKLTAFDNNIKWSR